MNMDAQDPNRKDMMIQIAKMYYLENRTQEEISRAVHISRSSISRLLKASREGSVK